MTEFIMALIYATCRKNQMSEMGKFPFCQNMSIWKLIFWKTTMATARKRDLFLNTKHLLKRSSKYKHYLTQHCVKAHKRIAWNVLSTWQYVLKWRRCFISVSFEVFNSFNLALEELLEKQTNVVLCLYSQAILCW